MTYHLYFSTFIILLYLIYLFIYLILLNQLKLYICSIYFSKFICSFTLSKSSLMILMKQTLLTKEENDLISNQVSTWKKDLATWHQGLKKLNNILRVPYSIPSDVRPLSIISSSPYICSGVARKFSCVGGSIHKAKYLVGIFFLLKLISTSRN